MIRPFHRRPGAAVGLPVLAVLVLLLVLGSCEGFFTDTNDPTTMEASDGLHPDRIVITWPAVPDDTTSDPPKTVEEYQIYRTQDWSSSPGPVGRRTTKSASYTDTEVNSGFSYTYQSRAVYTDANDATSFGAWLYSDTGYALVSTDIQIASSDSGATSYTYDAASPSWYSFLGQEGWTYRITLDVDFGVTTVELYRQNSIDSSDELRREIGGPGIRYRLPRSDVYHLKLSGGSGSFTVIHE